ncbi:unnamed protein product [Microthlaspi erraticum]|uniref:Uncharacterized protein n=1 Tax=Microthlaspi erraticum TaxID=1685480 RepID=A0A6D2IBP9_9BRAS|nr:unnamed protein product [Microthlaspi erraticum]
MRIDQMADNIWSWWSPTEKIKPKLKTTRNDVMFLEERNKQIHQVIIDVPAAGAQEKEEFQEETHIPAQAQDKEEFQGDNEREIPFALWDVTATIYTEEAEQIKEKEVWERLDIALICRARMKMSAAGQVGERLPKANISKQLYGSAAMLALLIDRRHQARQGMQAQAGHEEALVKCQVQHENTKLVAKQSLHFNLEDKVKFKGGSIVRSSG